MLIENIRPSRRGFLAGSAGLVVGFYLARSARARRDPAHGGRACGRAGHAVRAERLRAHRSRRHGEHRVQAHRDGTGALHGADDDRGRGARRRHGADARRPCARERRALQEPRLRRDGHRRLNRHRQQLRAAPPGRCHRARHAGGRSGRGMGGAGRRDRRGRRAHPPRRNEPRQRLRRARRERRPRSSWRGRRSRIRRTSGSSDPTCSGSTRPRSRTGRRSSRSTSASPTC